MNPEPKYISRKTKNSSGRKLSLANVDTLIFDESEVKVVDKDVAFTINESKEYSGFLLRVGFEFCVFYLSLVGIIVFMLLDVVRSRTLYRQFRLDILIWVILVLLVAIKGVFGIWGHKFARLIKLIFFVDILLSVAFVFGLYYFLQTSVDSPGKIYSPYVVIYVLNLFVASLGFTISSFYKSRSMRYNFVIGILIMTAATTVMTLGLCFSWNSVVTISRPQYVGIIFVMLIHNTYFALNAFMIVNYRTKKFYDEDSLWAFYCFFSDLCYRFWFDLYMRIKNTKSFIKKRQSKIVGVDYKKSKKNSKSKNNKEQKTVSKAAIIDSENTKDKKSTLKRNDAPGKTDKHIVIVE